MLVHRQTAQILLSLLSSMISVCRACQLTDCVVFGVSVLKFTILYSLNRHRLAKCQKNFADAGQAVLVESSDQGLQVAILLIITLICYAWNLS